MNKPKFWCNFVKLCWILLFHDELINFMHAATVFTIRILHVKVYRMHAWDEEASQLAYYVTAAIIPHTCNDIEYLVEFCVICFNKVA